MLTFIVLLILMAFAKELFITLKAGLLMLTYALISGLPLLFIVFLFYVRIK